MMVSLNRGFNFFIQSWQIVFRDNDLLKLSLYFIFIGMAGTVVMEIPLVTAFVYSGMQNIGQVIGYAFGVILIFAQYAVSYLFSAMTVYLVFGFISNGYGNITRVWEIVKRDWLDILSLALVSTLIYLLRNFIKRKGKAPLHKSLSSLIDRMGTEATGLVLPAMATNDLNLKDGLTRAT